MEAEQQASPHGSSVLELLTLLVSLRTAPGQAQVILSAAELDDRFRREAIRWFSEKVSDSDLRALRNEFVHRVITTNYDRFLEMDRDLTGVDAKFSDDRLRTTLLQIKQHGPSETWLETAALIADNFLQSLVASSDIIEKLSPDEALGLAHSAAEGVLASARWSQVVGDRIDTTAVTQLLGISRQALAKRQTAGSVIGLPGHSTTWYPTWQFDREAGEVRSEVRDIVGAFRDRLDNVDPFLIAAWATTPQEEDLDGLTPEHWIRLRRDPQRLRVAAERAASHISR